MHRHRIGPRFGHVVDALLRSRASNERFILTPFSVMEMLNYLKVAMGNLATYSFDDSRFVDLVGAMRAGAAIPDVQLRTPSLLSERGLDQRLIGPLRELVSLIDDGIIERPSDQEREVLDAALTRHWVGQYQDALSFLKSKRNATVISDLVDARNVVALSRLNDEIGVGDRQYVLVTRQILRELILTRHASVWRHARHAGEILLRRPGGQSSGIERILGIAKGLKLVIEPLAPIVHGATVGGRPSRPEFVPKIWMEDFEALEQGCATDVDEFLKFFERSFSFVADVALDDISNDILELGRD